MRFKKSKLAALSWCQAFHHLNSDGALDDTKLEDLTASVHDFLSEATNEETLAVIIYCLQINSEMSHLTQITEEVLDESFYDASIMNTLAEDEPPQS